MDNNEEGNEHQSPGDDNGEQLQEDPNQQQMMY